MAGLRPFRAIPKTLVEWTRWMRAQDFLFDSDGDGVDDINTAATRSTKMWSFGSPTGATGVFYFGGYYDFHSTSFTPAGGTLVGSANNSYAAHAIIVLGSASTDMRVRVSGTSITDKGVRTASDTQDVLCVGPVNSYFETSKKWIGTVSYSLVSGSGVVINAGWAKYWDFGNTNFKVVGCEATWIAGASDSTADIELIHHRASGWTYGAGGSPTPPTPIAGMNTDHVTENNIANNEPGAWKRTNLNTSIDGAGSEGTLWRVTTGANKAFELGNLEITVTQ